MSIHPEHVTHSLRYTPDQRSLFQSAVENAYAHHSDVYAFLADAASLPELVQFLQWDAQQPAFNVYLRRWLPNVPDYLRGPLEEHIEEEESEHHSALFRTLLGNLRGQVSVPNDFNQDALDTLNYTFSAQCVAERDHAFFAGAFFATEIMSADRCMQLWRGLVRLGLNSVGLPSRTAESAPAAGTYLGIHALGDADHGALVLRDFIGPILAREPDLEGAVWSGLNDRLARSAYFLRWYAAAFLPTPARTFKHAS